MQKFIIQKNDYQQIKQDLTNFRSTQIPNIKRFTTTARLACGGGLLGDCCPDRKASYRFSNLLTESASVTVAGRAFHSLTILLVNVFALCRHLLEAWLESLLA
ncbi:hypothetical protein BpHYR1_047072 [Brachionus plicatilis]|uniref:Uncharacterized protein n=1 Tax=Brachionus plicatilis TaxID=10195 RepID=A0A3M7QVW8_BRAPC|nr:hypothetical protein BpHYR1_047072 [Brachionus plicatilis]